LQIDRRFGRMDGHTLSNVHHQAKAELLQALCCKVTSEETGNPAGESLCLLSPDERQHTILIRLLDLDKAHSLKMPKSDFDYELRSNLWIFLVLYMHDMQPFCYLVPSTAFTMSSNLFVDNEQPPAFRYLSNWEIKVFRNGIAELSHYELDSVTAL